MAPIIVKVELCAWRLFADTGPFVASSDYRNALQDEMRCTQDLWPVPSIRTMHSFPVGRLIRNSPRLVELNLRRLLVFALNSFVHLAAVNRYGTITLSPMMMLSSRCRESTSMNYSPRWEKLVPGTRVDNDTACYDITGTRFSPERRSSPLIGPQAQMTLAGQKR
jgi:hypothetical protein